MAGPWWGLTKGVFRLLNIWVVGVWPTNWGQDHREAVVVQELWLSDISFPLPDERAELSVLTRQAHDLPVLESPGELQPFRSLAPSPSWWPAREQWCLGLLQHCNKVPQGQGLKQQAFTPHGSVRSPRSRFLVRALPWGVDCHLLLCPHSAESKLWSPFLFL